MGAILHAQLMYMRFMPLHRECWIQVYAEQLEQSRHAVASEGQTESCSDAFVVIPMMALR